MCTKSQLGCIVLYCRLRFGLDITIFFNLKFKPDNIIWSHHLGIVSPELQADVDVSVSYTHLTLPTILRV